MATLSVLKFDTSEGAQQMLSVLESLQRQQLIEIQDVAIVTWEDGKKKPKTRQLHNMAGVGTLSGEFWELLFGKFFIPVTDLAMGALGAHFSDYGIDDKFIDSVKEKVTPGTSALFLLTTAANLDQVVVAVKGMRFEIIQTNLTQEQEDQLSAAFAQEDGVPALTSDAAPATEEAANGYRPT